MSSDSTGATDRLKALRRSFDEAFAVPPRLDAEGRESMLLIRAAGEALAFRSLDIAVLARMERLLRVPSRIPELLGVAANRSNLVPVFSLAALLGLDAGSGQTKWIAVARGEPVIALAFDQIEAQADVRHGTLRHRNASADQSCPGSEYIQQLLRIGSVLRAVPDIPAIAEAIRRRAGLINQEKE